MKQKVTTVLEGRLKAEADELAARTNMGMADLLRIGLTKLAIEWRRTGTIKIEELPEPEQASA